MAKKKLVMFDFDGVLVNTHEYSYQIHKNKNPNFTWDAYLNFSNGNYYEGMVKAIENGHIPPTIEEYKNGYDKQLHNETVQDILHKTINKLAEQYTLSIVSSMYDDSIEKFLNKEDLSKYFSDVCGADFEKSKVKKMQYLLSKYELSPKESVIITDSLGDILEANAADVPSIGVLWGIHPHGTLSEGKPVKIIDDPHELYNSINEVLG